MRSPAVPLTDERRAFAALFASVAVSTTGFLASNTVNGLIAEDLLGSSTWSGLPAAASVLGTAVGASALAAVVRRVGPRMGLTLGYALATVAIGLASVAVVTRQFVLFVAMMLLFGVGYGANRLARYVAADQYPADRRATIIGWIVWAATIGAIGGPALLAPSRGLAESLGLNGLVGPYLVNVFSLVLATAAMLWAPPTMDAPARDMGASTTAADVKLGDVLAHAGVRLALAAMVSGQFVMVLLMTMTPLHVRHEGLGLGAIGLVISAHTLGMYAISPVTGRLGDLYGRVPLIVAGIITLVASGVVGIVATRGSYALLVLALLLLGVGWNLGFVGGSALLTESVTPQERVRLQGFGDSLVWGGGAIASLGSGWMLEHAGFAVLNAIGIVLSLAPLLPLMTYQRRVRAQPLEIESI